MSKPEPGQIFEKPAAVSAAMTAPPRAEPSPPLAPATETPTLSAAAREVAAQGSESAYSPIVLAGLVRVIEVALVAVVGFAVYFAYVVPTDGLGWRYVAAIVGIALLSMLAFQAADIYQVQAFRGHEKQYMRLASAWSVVFLIAIGVSFFAKAGDQFSRAWLGGFYVLGLVTLIALPPRAVSPGAPLDARGPARPPHRRGRRRRQRRGAHPLAGRAARFRRAHHRRVRRSRR